jgi:GT2 family glycosyltransferase
MNGAADDRARRQPAITVVVCTYRRAAKLDVCLTALARQSIADRIEIVVVDDGPDDDTAAVAARHPVRLVRHEHNRGLSAARNTGIAAARAPIVAFTDDDCVPASDWLGQLVDAYESATDAVGVGGDVTALQRTRLIHRYLADTNRLAPLEIELGRSASIPYRGWLYLKRNLGGPGPRPAVREVYSLVGANMSFRRDELVAIGGFDERIRFGGEDEDICRRLRAAHPDRSLLFTAHASIAHDFEGHLRDTVRRSYMYGAGSARSYLKNADQQPTCFPVPAVVVLLALLAVRRPRALAWAGATPLLAFGRWPVAAVRQRRMELLAYPYVQLVEELAHDAGFAQSWLRLRDQYTHPPEAANGTMPAGPPAGMAAEAAVA